MSLAEDLLEQGLALHQAGRLAEAEQRYRRLLETDPAHSDAAHLLGVVAHQSGRHALAIQWIMQAIALNALQPMYHNNLGEVYRTLGRQAEAAACFERALDVDPSFAAAHYNLGLLHGSNDPTRARRHYEQAIRFKPDLAVAHNNLGNLLHAQGKTHEAVEAYRRAIACQANYVDAIGNLGAALLNMGRTDEALEALRRAVQLAPDSAQAHFQLASACQAARDWQQAADQCRHAIRLRDDFDEARCKLANALRVLADVEGSRAEYLEVLRRNPDSIEALVGYGALLYTQGKTEEALEHYERALRIRPDWAPAHYYRASVLMFRHRRAEAVAGFTEALRLQPNYPEAHIKLAGVYNDAGRPDEALEHCHRARSLGATSGQLYGNMAIALHAQGRGSKAIECYRQSIELRSDDAAEYSNLIYALNLMPEYDPPALFAEHLEWAKRHAESLTAAAAAAHDNDRTPDRRLRLGYVSPHFHEHAVNFFVEPILAAHDHHNFEVFCYSSMLAPDAVTDRLKTYADHWRDVMLKTDEQLSQIVREDAIDILIDLSGHMGRTRLLTFARKPAPVQVTYIGYQNTTGMSAMDYRLTDERADPPGLTDRYYTERLIRLPRAFFCYQPFETPPVTALPAQEAGYVTFGSFNNFSKVTPQAIDAWLEILSRVPRSRLLVLAYRGGYLERHFHQLAAERGIESDRIELCDKRFRHEYLQLVQRADIALDPFPFNGHTTTCDSIWMGVPVVMLEGNSYASRFGGSVLANVGLEDLITRSVDDYIERAVELAGDVDRLTRLRSELRPRMAASPLLDFQGFTRNLENAYREMWIEWCRRKK